MARAVDLLSPAFTGVTPVVCGSTFSTACPCVSNGGDRVRTMLTRRQALSLGMGAGLGLLWAPAQAAGKPLLSWSRRRIMLERVESDTFADLVDTRFALQSPGGETIAATLRKVSDLAPIPNFPRRGFKLLFTCACTEQPPQGTWSMRHPRLEETAVFMVPVGLIDGHQCLEAVFN